MSNRNNPMNGSGQANDSRLNNTNKEAGRHPSRSQDLRGDAQNVEDDDSGRLSGQESTDARNKAMEGQKQGRDEG